MRIVFTLIALAAANRALAHPSTIAARPSARAKPVAGR